MDGFFDQYRSIRFGPITVQNIFCQKETEKTEQNNYQTVIHRSQLFLNSSNCFLTVHSHLQPLIKKRNGTTIKTVDFDKFYSKLFWFEYLFWLKNFEFCVQRLPQNCAHVCSWYQPQEQRNGIHWLTAPLLSTSMELMLWKGTSTESRPVLQQQHPATLWSEKVTITIASQGCFDSLNC